MKCKSCGQEIKGQNWIKIGKLEWLEEEFPEMSWYDAEKKCKEMGGRLPTRVELLDLYDNHFEEIEKLKVYGDNFWSATTHSNGTTNAWRVYLDHGLPYSLAKTDSVNTRVRCVR
jgi:hypothetical protein